VSEGLWIPAAAGVLAAIAVALGIFFWWKGRPFTEGDVFRASRWSSGNLPPNLAFDPLFDALRADARYAKLAAE